VTYFFFVDGDEDHGDEDRHGDTDGGGGGAAGLIRGIGFSRPDSLYLLMASSAGVRVEVDFSTLTGMGGGFLPSKITSEDWFPVARSFRVLPDGISLTSLGSFDLFAPGDVLLTFPEGCA